MEQTQIAQKATDEVYRSIDKLLFRSFSHKAETVDKLFRNARRFISKPGLDDRNFFGIHLPKPQTLIDAAKEEHRITEHEVPRLMGDEYQKILYKTQVFLNTGSLSLYQAIDQASKELLMGEIRSMMYRNGIRG